MSKVRFDAPFDSSDPLTGHYRWTYPYELITAGQGTRKDQTEEKKVTVDVTRSLYSTWKNQTGGDFPDPRLALFPFAVDAIGEAGKDGELPDEITKEFDVDTFREYTDNPGGHYPFNSEMIEEPEGQEYEVELSSGDMGFDVAG